MNINSIDDDWSEFTSLNTCPGYTEGIYKQQQYTEPKVNHPLNDVADVPTSSDLYISTKTMIAYLNVDNMIDIETLFWNIPIISYHEPREGIIKKQIKLTTNTKEENEKLEEKLKSIKDHSAHDIKNIDSEDKNIAYKNIKKINIGSCSKDLTSHRSKKKSVFYNCFALMIRIKLPDTFKEIHVKLFNTGKMEIPGIRDDFMLHKAFAILVDKIQPFFNHILKYKSKPTVALINSNFNCGFYINRDKLYMLLRHKYNILSSYDSCSYPGIQCKFYFNSNKTIQNGLCECETKCKKSKKNNEINNHIIKCREISFMIFRTGSVLIVGNCDNDILNVVYEYVKNILACEYSTISEGNVKEQITKNKIKYKRKIIIYTNEK